MVCMFNSLVDLLSSYQYQGREFISHTDLIHEVIPIKLFLDMVPSSSADNVIMRVAWMVSWTIRIRVEPLMLSTQGKFASQDWLFLDPYEIFETESILEKTLKGLPC